MRSDAGRAPAMNTHTNFHHYIEFIVIAVNVKNAVLAAWR
jgi:hypothetical protein